MAKPIPLIEAIGTSVDRMTLDRLKNSTAPERSWDSTSVSPPSWLFANSSISSTPLLSRLMRSKACCRRTFSGCVNGKLVANLYLKSASARARPVASNSDAAPQTTDRLLIFLTAVSRFSLPSTAAKVGGAQLQQDVNAAENRYRCNKARTGSADMTRRARLIVPRPRWPPREDWRAARARW